MSYSLQCSTWSLSGGIPSYVCNSSYLLSLFCRYIYLVWLLMEQMNTRLTGTCSSLGTKPMTPTRLGPLTLSRTAICTSALDCAEQLNDTGGDRWRVCFWLFQLADSVTATFFLVRHSDSKSKPLLSTSIFNWNWHFLRWFLSKSETLLLGGLFFFHPFHTKTEWACLRLHKQEKWTNACLSAMPLHLVFHT